ncbi:type I phosphomannose isomerase catalytic subunit [Fusobacterium varium]|uniref:type I phosphomannose isomerase catalytic subunit n=1 Tax=Fusobacterium varium TaxID=856 RepID=UPI000E41220D|nr:type I phosphomannose isomerase catalytic subunit [Fusobacterium varium]MCI6034105.1 class I mannose-6-phosphate isomerase [Fusobacterium varium]MDY4006587.1 type I phosphomannose isomerase catalytic subunit [Fusobacterium varium]RGJ26181.1 class I mannose-6-phosphate isomerase [Fusobacterium varium]
MYPLKFKKNLVKKVWGGRKFKEVLNMELPDNDLYGESWEVSSHKGGLSYVDNGDFQGKSLIELIEKYGKDILGEEIAEKFKGKFPLLIKYLDINDRLSVQVHPSDEYALRVEGEFGKSESWYIMEASDDATLILGIKDGITKEIFKERVEAKEFDGLFNTVKVKKGDFINLCPGVVHATMEGSILICEVQQNSDTTYRIYDFDRLVDGKLRELHIDKALDVIDFEGDVEITTAKSRKKILLAGAEKEELIRGEYFNIDKYLVDGEFKDEINRNFKVYSILDGEGKIIYNEKEYHAEKGDTYFIPAGLELKIIGKLEILKSFI